MVIASASTGNDSPELANGGIADLLLRAAQRQPNTGIYTIDAADTYNARLLSYPALLEEARCICGGLQSSGYEPGSHVVLWLERCNDFLPALWACILGGYVPCPLASIRNDPTRWTKHIAHLDALLDKPLFVTTRDRLANLPTTSSMAVDQLRRSAPLEKTYRAGRSDAAILMLTSGSTGNPKAVVLTHGNLLASMAGKTDTQRLTAADVTLNWISFDHVAALLEAHMLPLYVGASQLHVQPEAILADPLLFIRLIDQFRVSMTFTPNFLLGQINALMQREWFDHSRRQDIAMDLSCLRHIISGGEANVVETGRRFLDLLAPYGLSPRALWPAFGMTETCAGSIYSREFPAIDAHREFASVGVPIKGLQMRIVADEGVSLPTGELGELQLKGHMIFDRYHNNEDATRAAFTADGWFRTGDLGQMVDGQLILAGRKKDTIIVSGVNYASHELETTLEQLEGIDRSFVAAFATRPKGADTEQLVVTFAATFPMNAEDRLYQLIVAVRNTTIMLWGFRPALVLALPRGAFQKTSLGKIQRSIMRQRLEAGEFAADILRTARLTERQLGIYTPPDGRLEREIVEVFAELLSLSANALSATANFFELGGTSLEILRLTQTIERRFKIQLSLTTILQNPTPRKLAAYIDSATHAQARQYDPIVPLQLSGSKTPLFCIHPGNGSVLAYVNLAKYFVNERPFYALRPPGFEAGESCFETFEAMESAYLDAIRKYQPHGPYAILGYSYGGPIAFEIAKILQASGEQIAFLGCIDCPPLVGLKATDDGAAAAWLAWLLGFLTPEQRDEAITELKARAPHPQPCEFVLAIEGVRDRAAEFGLDLAKFSAWTRVIGSLLAVCSQRDTAGRVDAMTVFYGSERTAMRDEPIESIKRWDTFVRKPKYIEIAGDHFTLMGPQHVTDFQATLRAEIDEAFRNHEASTQLRNTA